MIYCVWYPSGGFGHFVNAILTLHGAGFKRPSNKLQFSKNGNSHNLQLIVPKWSQGKWLGNFEFDPNINYCVLIDNGINDENDQFKKTFDTAVTIKVCYSDHSWPIVAKTMIDKAMQSSIEKELSDETWSTDEPWAKREKYFLFLRDHPLRVAWRRTNDYELQIDCLLNYDRLFAHLNSLVEVETFDTLWKDWRQANAKYIDPIETAKKITTLVTHKQSYNLTHITDLWTQSVIYYYIWIEFGVEVPHNDFSNFFTNTDQIIDLVT